MRAHSHLMNGSAIIVCYHQIPVLGQRRRHWAKKRWRWKGNAYIVKIFWEEGGHHCQRHLIQNSYQYTTLSTDSWPRIQQFLVTTWRQDLHPVLTTTTFCIYLMDPGLSGSGGVPLPMPRLATFTSTVSARVLRGNADSFKICTFTSILDGKGSKIRRGRIKERSHSQPSWKKMKKRCIIRIVFVS